MQYFCKNCVSSENGQAILIVILIMVISLTVALSVISRSIIHVKTTSDEADSQKAFSAAEAGVEEALQSGNGVALNSQAPFANGAQIKEVQINALQGNNFVINDGNTVPRDEGLDLWLSNFSTNPAQIYQQPRSGNLTVYWGTSPTGCNDAAIEVILLSQSGHIDRFAYDPCGPRRGANHLSTATAANQNFPSPGVTLRQSAIIAVTNGYLARIVPLYQNEIIGVRITDPRGFPVQGNLITSTGQSGSAERKITYFQGNEGMPAQFYYSFFQTQ